MKIRQCSTIPLALTGLLAAVAGTAQAQSSDACQPFTVISDASERAVEFVDTGASGPSPGDRRIGYRALADQDGDPVGYYRWVITTLDHITEPGGAGEGLQNYVMVLADGHIGFQRLVQTGSPAHDTDTISWIDPQPAYITGGTGAYAFARGTVDVERDGQTVTLDVNVRCD